MYKKIPEQKIKKVTLRFRAVNSGTFNAIRDGRKTVETRAATKRYRDVQAENVIVFVCGKERFERTIKKVRHFKTVGALLKATPLKHVMPELSTIVEARRAYYSYPGYREKIEKYGLMAFYL